MTKKEYILAVVDTFPNWETGWGIKAMVQNDQLDEETIDKLVIIFKRVMNKLATTIRENRSLEILKSMEKLDKQKEEQAKEDAKTLEDLDSKLNDF